MALKYAEKLEYSTLMRQKFTEIKKLKQTLLDCIEEENQEQYDYIANIIFTKISVIEINIVNLKKAFLEAQNEN